ncbi:MAG: hypothetical protein ACRDQ2_14155 [Gaiellales bacterium]
MEIKDRLALVWRRLWLVLLVPLVAGGVMAMVESKRDVEYRATASVAVPGLLSGEDRQYSGTNGTRAYVANFIAVAESRAVSEAVAAETNVAFESVRSGLRVVPVGESSVVRITYRSDRAADAVPVSRAVASHALAAVFAPGAERAGQVVEGAKKTAADAVAAVDAFVAETKLPDPGRAYQIKAQQAAALEAQAVSAGARGEAETAAVLSRAAASVRQELDALVPVQARYDSLLERKDRALNLLDEAERAFAAANDRLQASDPSRAVTDSGVVRVERARQATTKVAAAMAAALFLVLLALYAVESAFRPTVKEPDLTSAIPQT